jgi:hypothetical protein
MPSHTEEERKRKAREKSNGVGVGSGAPPKSRADAQMTGRLPRAKPAGGAQQPTPNQGGAKASTEGQGSESATGGGMPNKEGLKERLRGILKSKWEESKKKKKKGNGEERQPEDKTAGGRFLKGFGHGRQIGSVVKKVLPNRS